MNRKETRGLRDLFAERRPCKRKVASTSRSAANVSPDAHVHHFVVTNGSNAHQIRQRHTHTHTHTAEIGSNVLQFTGRRAGMILPRL